MTSLDRTALIRAVQANCHIADARHAADMTLCTYLLLMREFFRWEQGIALGAALDRAAVGAWIAAREALWEQVEAQPLAPIVVDAAAPALDPFDVAAINERLAPHGLLYGAGLVGAERPVFFLAELASHDRRDGVAVWTAGREWARGLLAPPAVLASTPPAIVLRRDAIRRACWQRYEAYALRPRPGSALAALVTHYGLDRDLDRGLSQWTDDQAEIARLHELGEARVGERLGPAWSAMRLALASRRAALAVQAVRDLLADLDTTLPALLEGGRPVLVHGWFAQFDGVRQALCPGLDAAYRGWHVGDGGRELRATLAHERVRCEALAARLLDLHARHGSAAGAPIEALLYARDDGGRATAPGDAA